MAWFNSSKKLLLCLVLSYFFIFLSCAEKRDLVYHEIIDWMLIRQHAANFDQDLLDEYVHEQRIKKRPWYLKTKEKLMYRAGMI